LVEDVTSQIQHLMDREGVSRSELARRLGSSRQGVSLQFERGVRTLAVLARCADAIGYEPAVMFRRKSEAA
jgi:transcriptional regulator with XRE-family HTH domain